MVDSIANDGLGKVALELASRGQPERQPREVSLGSSPGEERSSGEESAVTMAMQVSKSRGIAIIVTLAGINFLNTMGSGLLIAILPHVARDVGLSDGLILCMSSQAISISLHEELQGANNLTQGPLPHTPSRRGVFSSSSAPLQMLLGPR